MAVANCQATYFGRDDIALPGFSKRFKEASQEETSVDILVCHGNVIRSRLTSPLSTIIELGFYYLDILSAGLFSSHLRPGVGYL